LPTAANACTSLRHGNTREREIMAAVAEFESDAEDWDQETMVELRRFALEQALTAHLHKRDTPADLGRVFQDADRIVNYVVGDLDP
jgi:hypothetical protein